MKRSMANQSRAILSFCSGVIDNTRHIQMKEGAADTQNKELVGGQKTGK